MQEFAATNLKQWQSKLDEKGTLVCLNFKVPLQMRQQFKIYAARRNMTMTELLIRLFNDHISSDLATRDIIVANEEIKK